MLALIDTYRFVVKRWCYFVYTLCKFLRGCYRFSVASFVDENVLNVFHFTSPHTLRFSHSYLPVWRHVIWSLLNQCYDALITGAVFDILVFSYAGFCTSFCRILVFFRN